jgi:hypothetical protein
MFDDYDILTGETKSKFPKFFAFFGGPLQFLAALITMVGTFFVAQPEQQMRFYGFCIYFFSNLLWIGWALLAPGRGGVLITYIVNFACNILGIYNNYPGKK